MPRVGAVDCGTNSIRLLIADIEHGPGAAPVLTDVVREMEVVRLGYGVDRTGRIDPAAMARTLAVAARYAGACEELGAEAVRFVATSASEEAELSFTGATGDVVAAGHLGPYLVCDIGGGSTELVRGEATATGARVVQSHSADVGCVRMTERHLAGDPPTPAEVLSATADIEAALDDTVAAVDISGAGTLVGLAGSVTTVTAHALRLERYDPERIHLAVLTPERIDEATAELLAMGRAERAALPFMHPGRVDVIGAGGLVWDRVVRRVVAASPGVSIVTSEHDILDGIALSAARRVVGA